jgi:nitrogen fixation/metabolism regulation signal transduction histidine kinase
VATLELHAVSILPSRGVRWLLLAAACLSAITMFLLATATSNTALFARGYDALFVVNGVMVALLMLIVGWQLWQLRRKLRAGVFGSRLAVRLVLLFALVAVLPGALVYAVSVQFLGRSIESWFDVRVDRALDSGLNLGRTALDYLLKDTTNKAQQIAISLSDVAGNFSPALNRAAEQASVYEAILSTPTGGVLAVAGIGGSATAPEPPPAAALRRARLQQTFAAVEQHPKLGLVVRVVVPVNSGDRLDPLKLLQLLEPVPKTLAQEIEKVEAGYRDYQEISFSRQSLKRVYALTLTLTLLLALTSALGLAVVLSERFSAPLGLLAEGTRAVAQGDFTRRTPVTSKDELGVLTESFNTMTAQLADANARNEDARRAIETTRAYLESVLGNLSAGVLAFDDRYRLRTANPSAAVILQQPLTELDGLALAEWGRRLPALAPFAELVAEGFRGSRDGQWQREAELAVAALTRTLLLRGTRLSGAPNAGYVVVFDDVSELVLAQRDAAWAEVARRLAHEIKNPLTPIQLSAERLAVKLEPKLAGADLETLRPWHADDRCPGGRDEAHGRRLRDLCAAAAAGPDAAGRRRLAVARCPRTVREPAPARVADAARRVGRDPGRADAAAPGVPQSAAECDRRAGRRGRSGLLDHAGGARRRGGPVVHRWRRRICPRRADARVRTVCDDQGQGHGPRTRDC